LLMWLAGRSVSDESHISVDASLVLLHELKNRRGVVTRASDSITECCYCPAQLV
jgi:hypothetical protein